MPMQYKHKNAMDSSIDFCQSNGMFFDMIGDGMRKKGKVKGGTCRVCAIRDFEAEISKEQNKERLLGSKG